MWRPGRATWRLPCERASVRRARWAALPYADGTFDAATVGFGARNFSDLDRGLAEMARVVRPGGRVVVLEITTPRRPPLSTFFSLWFDRVVPLLGRLSGEDQAYTYLPSSVKRFPGPAELGALMHAVGLEDVRWILAAGGKRLRPLLVFVAAGPSPDDPEAVLRAAVAVELVHSATLVHDDVLDGARLRRGRPTVVAVAGRGMATATGDLLGRFGRRIGLAFQLLDDVLDVSGPAERTGKHRGTDLLDGTVTLPLILAGERDPGLASLDLRAVRTPAQAEAVCDAIAATGVLDDARARALGIVADAKGDLPVLPEAQQGALELVADGVVDRFA